MTSLPKTIVLLLAVPALLFACGGGESRPGPLKHHLDDMFIAQVPIAEKQSVLQAQQDYHVARMERAKAEADYNEAGTDLQVAKNERDRAALDEKTADAKKKGAEKTGDLNRINAAALLVREAKLMRRAADKKIEYMKARRDFLKKYMNYTEDAQYAREARYELSKARVARDNNIRPRDFAFENYQRQAEERTQYAQRSKADIDRDKQVINKLRDEWKGLEREARQARGGASTGKSTGTTTTTKPAGSSTKSPPRSTTPDQTSAPQYDDDDDDDGDHDEVATDDDDGDDE